MYLKNVSIHLFLEQIVNGFADISVCFNDLSILTLIFACRAEEMLLMKAQL